MDLPDNLDEPDPEDPLSEFGSMSRSEVSGCGGCDRSAGARAYLGPRPLGPVTRWLMGRSAGDDSGRSVFSGAPPGMGGSRDICGSWPEVLEASQDAGAACAIGCGSEWVSAGESGSGDRGEGVGAEVAQDVEAAAGELAGDGQRRAGMGEPAGLEAR